MISLIFFIYWVAMNHVQKKRVLRKEYNKLILKAMPSAWNLCIWLAFLSMLSFRVLASWGRFVLLKKSLLIVLTRLLYRWCEQLGWFHQFLFVREFCCLAVPNNFWISPFPTYCYCYELWNNVSCITFRHAELNHTSHIMFFNFIFFSRGTLW